MGGLLNGFDEDDDEMTHGYEEMEISRILSKKTDRGHIDKFFLMLSGELRKLLSL